MNRQKRDFLAGGIGLKGCLRFFVPYMITRIIALLFATDISVKMVLLDITCLKAQYAYGWYMTYLLFWYVVFWLIQITVPKYKYIIIVALSIISFFAAPSASQAQQALSFGTGVFLSDLNEEKKNALCKQSIIIIVVTFVIGCVAFLIKQFVEIEEMSYEMWALKLLYRFAWAIMVIFVAYLLCQKVSLSYFRLTGKISYEIFLIHGYCLGIANDVKMMPICLLVCVGGALVLHFVVRWIKQVVLHKSIQHL